VGRTWLDAIRCGIIDMNKPGQAAFPISDETLCHDILTDHC